MNKYCIFLNKIFLDDLVQICNDYIHNIESDLILNFKQKIQKELQKASNILYYNNTNFNKVKYNQLFQDIFIIEIQNLQKINIWNNDITIKINNGINDYYLLKYGKNHYILFEDDLTYAKIPVYTYSIFKSNRDRENFNLDNSMTGNLIKKDIIKYIKNNKITSDDNMIVNYTENGLEVVIENGNITYIYNVRRPGGLFKYELLYFVDKEYEDKIVKHDKFKDILFGLALD